MSHGPQNIVQKAAPDTAGQPQVNFDKTSFEAIVWQKGYRVHHDKAIKCPCKVEGTDNLSDCHNCGGSGWVFFNRVETRMVLRSMNLNTQYKDWSEETLGTVSISASDSDKIAYMDRITVLDAETLFSEVIYPKNYKGVRFALTTYDIKSVETVFLFVGSKQALVLLEEGVDYTVADNRFELNYAKYKDFPHTCIGIRYIHAPTYHIIDMPRDTMASPIKNISGIPEDKLMPISAVGRRAHFVLDAQNYAGDYIIDNSYTQHNC